jgi:hypothetical protein
LGERARGAKHDEAETVAHAVTAMMALSCENVKTMELRGGFHGGSVFTS